MTTLVTPFDLRRQYALSAPVFHRRRVGRGDSTTSFDVGFDRDRGASEADDFFDTTGDGSA